MRNILHILSFCIFFISIHVGAQSFSIQNGVTVGTLTNGKAIKARMYTFNGETPSVQIDTINQKLLVSTRELIREGKPLTNRGHIYLFDLKNGSKNWSLEIDYRKEEALFTPMGVMLFNNSKSRLLDLDSGRELWKKKFYFQAFQDSCLFVYKTSAMSKLQRRDIKTGDILWETKSTKKYGWNGFQQINDSCILISADGLWCLNLNDGSGWSFDAKTHVKKYGTAVAVSALGMLFGLVTGVGFMQTSPDFITGLGSNTIIEDGVIY